MKRVVLMLILTSFVGIAAAQQPAFPVNLDHLAAKAVETVDVTMEGPTLKMAGKFLSPKDPEEAQAKLLIEKLKGIYVRSFEFDKAGAYSDADVAALRAQFTAPAWSRVVGARSKRDGENVDVYFKMENDQIAGLAVIAAEPTELTVVHIVGPIDPEQLSHLGGVFGVPRVEVKPAAKKAANK